jgi:hypothetical protein
MQWNRNLVSAVVMGLLTTGAMSMTAAEHSAAKEQISADYKAAKEACKTLAGNAKDICEKQAKGKEKVATAELKARKEPSEKNRYNARVASVDAAYEVSKERCEDLSGNPKDVCLKDAKAAQVRGVQEAKVVKAKEEPARNAQAKQAEVAKARANASSEMREADYKAAKERCEVLSGDRKEACEADAKRKYGQ